MKWLGKIQKSKEAESRGLLNGFRAHKQLEMWKKQLTASNKTIGRETWQSSLEPRQSCRRRLLQSRLEHWSKTKSYELNKQRSHGRRRNQRVSTFKLAVEAGLVPLLVLLGLFVIF